MPIFINGLVAGIVQCEQGTQTRHWDSEDIAFYGPLLILRPVKRGNQPPQLRINMPAQLNDAGDIIYTTDSLGNFDFINQAVKQVGLATV